MKYSPEANTTADENKRRIPASWARLDHTPDCLRHTFHSFKPSSNLQGGGTVNMCIDCNVIRVMVDGYKAYYAPNMDGEK